MILHALTDVNNLDLFYKEYLINCTLFFFKILSKELYRPMMIYLLNCRMTNDASDIDFT